MSEISVLYQKDSLEENFARFQFQTRLSDKDYVLSLSWNSRMALWFLDVLGASEEPLLLGLPLFVNTDLMSRFQSKDLPEGVLFLLDTSEENKEAGFDDLGDRCVLLYAEP